MRFAKRKGYTDLSNIESVALKPNTAKNLTQLKISHEVTHSPVMDDKSFAVVPWYHDYKIISFVDIYKLLRSNPKCKKGRK